MPTSAVTTNGNLHTVTVLEGSTTRQVTVRVGVVGPTYTEVLSGLSRAHTATVGPDSTPRRATVVRTGANGLGRERWSADD